MSNQDNILTAVPDYYPLPAGVNLTREEWASTEAFETYIDAEVMLEWVVVHQAYGPITSDFYEHPPSNAPAVFSTHFGKYPYKRLTHPPQTRIVRTKPQDDLQDYADMLRIEFPETTLNLRPLTQVEEMHNYFDVTDLHCLDVKWLWEVLRNIVRWNRRNGELARLLVAKWIARPGVVDRLKTVPAGVDVINSRRLNIYDGSFLSLGKGKGALTPARYELVRRELNAARRRLEPELKAERDAAEAERLRQEEKARLEQERLERVKVAAAKKAEEEAEVAKRQASRERNARFDRSQAQSRGPVANTQWLNQAGPPMGPPMNPYMGKSSQTLLQKDN